MKNIEELCIEAKWGQLTKEEIAYVVKMMNACNLDDDVGLVRLIYILGHAYLEEHKLWVEKFIYYPKSTLVSQQALKALCTCWHLTEHYLDEIKMYIRGVDWDDADEVRLTAINIAGEFLRKKFDKELLQLLVLVFEKLGETEMLNDTDDYARDFLKSCAYEAIARAMGKNHNEIPDNDEIEEAIASGQLSDLDLAVVQKAHQMMEKNKG